MTTIRFIHAPDLHLGFRQGPWMARLKAGGGSMNLREYNVYRAVASLDTQISKLDPPPAFAIFPGDVFDSPNPPPRALLSAYMLFYNLEARGTWVLSIPGNHDAPEFGGISPVDLLNRIFSKAHLPADANTDIEIGGVFITLSRVQRWASGAFRPSKNPASIFVAHTPVSGPREYRHIQTQWLPEGYAYYALGDLHRYWAGRSGSVHHIYYAGASDAIPGFAERDNVTGFIVVDMDVDTGDFEAEFVENKFCTYLEELVSEEDAREFLDWFDGLAQEISREEAAHRCFVNCRYEAGGERPSWVEDVAKAVVMFKTSPVRSSYVKRPPQCASISIEEEIVEFFKSRDADDLASEALNLWRMYHATR